MTPVLIIVVLYYFLGRGLKQNALSWAFIGLAILVVLRLLSAPFLLFLKTPDSSILFWSWAGIASYIIAMAIAFIIAFRNKLISL